MNTMPENGDSPDRTWTVRIAEVRDLDALAGFSARTAEETEGVKIDPRFIRDGLSRVIENPALGCMFIAEEGERPLGSCFLNGREFTEWRNGIFYWFTGMYVIPEYRRQGVRFDLYRAAYDWASDQPDVLGLRAYVHKDTNLETMLGNHTGEIHNRPEYTVKPMVATPYTIIEILI